MGDYIDFLAAKQRIIQDVGFHVADADLNPALFDFQRPCVQWALRRGRAALFQDCGLGKSIQQLEWAHHVQMHTQEIVLILAPLAVGAQTVREGEKFGIAVKQVAEESDIDGPGIYVTNYERLHKFPNVKVAGVVLDESSILKSFTSKTKMLLFERFADTQFKLCCTATPAPNDHTELGNHAEFLGIMSRTEMLSMYFVHDGGDTQSWRLKGHAESEFWKWVCTWAVLLRRPSDLDFPDEGFNLPELHMISHVIPASYETAQEAGMLFPAEAKTLTDQRAARRASMADRIEVCAELVNGSDEQWFIWCELNDEGKALEKAIPDAVEIEGSDSHEFKERAMMDFISGKIRVVVSKSRIAGFGMNFQNCRNTVFISPSHSYEQTYQSLRRFWRFGQTKEVNCHVISSELEGAVVANLRRKERDAQVMIDGMAEHMKAMQKEQVMGAAVETLPYIEETVSGNNWTLHLGDCIEVAKSLDDGSIDYTIFSPPFASLYTYSNSERDMGNCADHDEFFQHFNFLIPEMLRVTKPGRLLSFHCMNLPTSKVRDGVIGLTDFRGQLIKAFSDAGWIYHSEVVIWKDPVTAMQRTKALGLLHKTIRKDSAMSRQGIPDYLVTMRKPGDNPDPISHTAEEFPVSVWQRYASPVWMDINPSDTLQFRAVREEKDERHLCPLQLQVIERGMDLWSNPNDLVFSPFTGIGSEGYIALKKERRFVGAELKRSYFDAACRNLRHAETEASSKLLFA